MNRARMAGIAVTAALAGSVFAFGAGAAMASAAPTAAPASTGSIHQSPPPGTSPQTGGPATGSSATGSPMPYHHHHHHL
jgi:hypothetical protein